jgi:hypothetical protein
MDRVREIILVLGQKEEEQGGRGRRRGFGWS